MLFRSGSQQNYTVKVVNENPKSSEKQILIFMFVKEDNAGFTDAGALGTIDEPSKKITVILSNGTDITKLKARFSLSDHCSHDYLYCEDWRRAVRISTHERTWKTEKTDKYLPHWVRLGGLDFLSACYSSCSILDIGGVRMIEFENISFFYDTTPEEKSLRDFSLTVSDGECLLIAGPSGCGKSTLRSEEHTSELQSRT